jgi:hypothetical protein
VSNGDLPPVPTPATVLHIGSALLEQGVIIPSFAQFAVTGEDNLRILTIGNGASGGAVEVHGRFLDAKSQTVIPFRYVVAIGANGVVTTQDFPLGLGYILNLTAIAVVGASVDIGQVYTLVSLIRGLGGATIVLGALIGGYVTNTQPLGWPGSPIRNSIEGPGWTHGFNAGTGAAANFAITVPLNRRWGVRSMRFAFTAAAGGVARSIDVAVVRGGGTTTIVPSPVTVAGGATINYDCAPAYPQAATAPLGEALLPWPPNLTLQTNDQISAFASNFQAGDTWAAALDLEEWLAF